jgi:hypothetical protein
MNDDEYFQAELEREKQSEEALDEALAKGVSREHLIVLARETGCTRWALHQSLKGA